MTDDPASCLIGHTGFVGGSIARECSFGHLINSGNVETMRGGAFSTVVCCGVPGIKWRANQDPESDRRSISVLADILGTVTADRFILISTVDVYPVPRRVDESSDCRIHPNHAYGTHRLEFEEFVAGRFPAALVVRLPALFGAGLKKNVLFDLLHDNGTDAIQPLSRFQWYDTARLWDDIRLALGAGLSLVNLVCEPVETAEIAQAFFPERQIGKKAGVPVTYDVQTLHAPVFGGSNGYVMSRSESFSRMAAFVAQVRSQPR